MTDEKRVGSAISAMVFVISCMVVFWSRKFGEIMIMELLVVSIISAIIGFGVIIALYLLTQKITDGNLSGIIMILVIGGLLLFYGNIELSDTHTGWAIIIIIISVFIAIIIEELVKMFK